MAGEYTALRNNALPYPVYGVPWTVMFPVLDADGDPLSGVTCDSEVSKNGADGVDCTNEGTEVAFTTVGNKSLYFLTLTTAEMTADILGVMIGVDSGKVTPITLYPRKLVALASGTSQGGAAGYITLAASTVAFDGQFNGCLCVATIDGNVEARILQACTTADQQCTVTPNWNVTPDADDTYIIYLPEGMYVGAAIGTPVALDSGAPTVAGMLAKMADDNAGQDFDAALHSQLATAENITAVADAFYAPDASSTITTGTALGGPPTTYANCAADDGTRWEIGDENGTNTIDVICEFNMGASRTGAEVDVNGFFNRSGGGGYVVEVYAYNYSTSAWDKISGGSAATELWDRSSDTDYVFSLLAAHTDRVTTPGEVKINFRSTRGTSQGGDELHLDMVRLTGQAAGGTSPSAIAQAVWIHGDGHSLRHVPKFTGHQWFIDGTNGSDTTNSGTQPDDALATFGAAITAASAGDSITVFAGTYTETGIDLNVAGLEVHGEIGAVIDPASGSALTISAAHCLVTTIEVRPAAGEIGFDIASGSDHSHLDNCKQTATGGTGFKIDSATTHILVTRSEASEYTSIGMEINGANCIIEDVSCDGQGGSETGFKLNHTNAHHNRLLSCDSIDNATASFHVIVGADDNLFHGCADTPGCGARVDAGANNAWRAHGEADAIPAELTAAAQQDIAQLINARSTWFVNKAGSDANGGLSWDDADLTIGAAVAAASAGDKIVIGPGTYTEAVDSSALANLEIVGAGMSTIISQTAANTLKIGNGTTVRDIKCVAAESPFSSPSTAKYGLDCSSKTDIRLINVSAFGDWDGLFAQAANRLWIENCHFSSYYDGANLSQADNVTSINTIYETNGSYSSIINARAINAEGSASNFVIRGGALISRRPASSVMAAVGLGCGTAGQHILEGVLIIAEQQNGGASGAACGVADFDGTPNLASVVLSNCQIHTSQSGSGAEYHLSNDTGTILVDGSTLYDTAKTNGTITHLTTVNDFTTAAKALLQTEADDALVARKLDHLLAVAESDDAVDDSIIAKLASATGDWSTFVGSSDAQEAIANAIAALISVGSGAIAVDHDTGGAGNLTYKTGGGAGIDNATVQAYLQTDYDAGNLGITYLKGTSTTNVDGEWEKQMMLDAGTYAFRFFKQAQYGPDWEEDVEVS